MRQSELKELIQDALQSAEQSIEIFKGNDNPQVIEMKNKYIGQANAFSAVLEALNNNRVYLKILNLNQKIDCSKQPKTH